MSAVTTEESILDKTVSPASASLALAASPPRLWHRVFTRPTCLRAAAAHDSSPGWHLRPPRHFRSLRFVAWCLFCRLPRRFHFLWSGLVWGSFCRPSDRHFCGLGFLLSSSQKLSLPLVSSGAPSVVWSGVPSVVLQDTFTSSSLVWGSFCGLVWGAFCCPQRHFHFLQPSLGLLLSS